MVYYSLGVPLSSMPAVRSNGKRDIYKLTDANGLFKSGLIPEWEGSRDPRNTFADGGYLVM